MDDKQGRNIENQLKPLISFSKMLIFFFPGVKVPLGSVPRSHASTLGELQDRISKSRPQTPSFHVIVLGKYYAAVLLCFHLRCLACSLDGYCEVRPKELLYYLPSQLSPKCFGIN